MAIDPRTGRIYRGKGEPERFFLKDRPIPDAARHRAAWITQQTGYPADLRTVYVQEALRAAYYREREQRPVFDSAQMLKQRDYWPREMRTSERKTFQTCPTQWWWSYVEGLAPKQEATPLWFGSAVHEALAAWYRKGSERGPEPAETFLEVLDGERKMKLVKDEDSEVAYVEARALGVAMLEGYIEKYGRDEHMDILEVEKQAVLVFRRAGKKWLTYRLTVDGLYRDTVTGQLLLLEHKTFTSMTLNLRLDPQAGSYYAAAPFVFGDHGRLDGIGYNFLRKQMPDERPRNAEGFYTNKPEKKHYFAALANGTNEVRLTKMKLEELEELARMKGVEVHGEVSKVQPAPLFVREAVYRTPAEQKSQLQNIQDEATLMEYLRAGVIPLTKSVGQHCSWCPFKTMCELDEGGDQVEVEAFKKSMYAPRDPYAAYHEHPKEA